MINGITKISSQQKYIIDVISLPESTEIVCYGKLKISKIEAINFFTEDYIKYENVFGKNQNIADKFILNLFLRRKNYFKKKYNYNEKDWNYSNVV